MSENQEDRSSEDLTEESSQKAEELRSKGIVSQSKEFTSFIVLFVVGIATFLFSSKIFENLTLFMKEMFQMSHFSSKIFRSDQDMIKYLIKAFQLMIYIVLPISFLGFFFGIIASLIQVGVVFSINPLTPDFNKINPMEGIKKLFSKKQLMEFLKITGKLIVVLGLSYFLLKKKVFESSQNYGLEPFSVLSDIKDISSFFFSKTLIVLFCFSLGDYIFQKFAYGKKIKMTKEESKREHREKEGDPKIKGRIRMIQREMSRKRMMQSIKKADVIITNPTHIAVAIYYDKNKMSAPRVVAKGADFLAQKIKEVAVESKVPLIENVSLARTLYKTVKIGQAIPRNLYQAVAEVLAHIYKIKSKF